MIIPSVVPEYLQAHPRVDEPQTPNRSLAAALCGIDTQLQLSAGPFHVRPSEMIRGRVFQQLLRLEPSAQTPSRRCERVPHPLLSLESRCRLHAILNQRIILECLFQPQNSTAYSSSSKSFSQSGQQYSVLAMNGFRYFSANLGTSLAELGLMETASDCQFRVLRIHLLTAALRM